MILYLEDTYLQLFWSLKYVFSNNYDMMMLNLEGRLINLVIF